MYRFCSFIRGLAAASILACLWLPPQVAHAQDGVPLPPAKLEVTTPATTPAATPPPSGQAAPAAEPKKEKPPESPWAKIPNLPPVYRPGLFLIPPIGEGYYTACDCLKGNRLDKPPAYPYRLLFYDNDFRYLDKPDGKPVDFLDELKRIHLGALFGTCNDNWIYSIGGEERVQIKNEISSRLTNRDNDYQLLRTRVYGDLWYKDVFRVYVEYLDARSFNEDLPPLPIDVNHSDLLNAFIDLKVGEVNSNPIYARVGRQEMLYGAQRLVSPLDWANTRRTFEGAKVFWHSDKLDLDAFWVRPLVTSPGHYDSANFNQQFAGTYATYRPAKGHALEAYYFYLDSNLPVAFGGTNGGRAGYDINTFGSRYSGDHELQGLGGDLLWDFEAAYQFGDYSNRFLSSGMATAGLGYHFKHLPMQPQFWAYYDYASGSPNPTGAGTFSTFNQLFPFGHYYFGYLDEVGRENIHDWNFQAVAYPAKWVLLLAQFHVFRLDQARDALYGTPPGFPVLRRDLTGRAGTNVGNEIDLLATFQVDRHNSVSVGFSKLFSGDFIKQTGPNVNPELYYLQYTLRW
jgi:hypothetical protein